MPSERNPDPLAAHDLRLALAREYLERGGI
jgi:hypothetical protein